MFRRSHQGRGASKPAPGVANIVAEQARAEGTEIMLPISSNYINVLIHYDSDTLIHSDILYAPIVQPIV